MTDRAEVKERLRTFIGKLPAGRTRDSVSEFLAGLSKPERRAFEELLFSRGDGDDSTTVDGSTPAPLIPDSEPADGFARRLWAFSPTGYRPGDIYRITVFRSAVLPEIPASSQSTTDPTTNSTPSSAPTTSSTTSTTTPTTSSSGTESSDPSSSSASASASASSSSMKKWEEEQRREAERELERRGWIVDADRVGGGGAGSDLLDKLDPVKLEAEMKKKKEAINKKLIEQYHKNQEEAARLMSVKKELDQLDNMLAGDIFGLREAIDEHDRAVNSARSQYLRKEREYALAKVQLDECIQRKKECVDKLQHIIAQNEDRKAKKLEELMGKLENKPLPTSDSQSSVVD